MPLKIEALAVAIAIEGALAWASTATAEGPPVDRLAAIADYLASDYAGAVADGGILSPAEYQEQRGLLEEARSLVVMAAPRASRPEARAALAASVERLVADFGAKVSAAALAADCRGLVAELFDGFGLAVGPVQLPSAARAADLYGTSCAPCHGAGGRADTENARKLAPHPVSFFDEAHMSRLSPRTAFEALEFGVANTAMASFAVFSPDDRWSLAFKVVAWRHAAPPAELERGAALFRSASLHLAATPTRLAELTDAELSARLAPAFTAAADRAAVLAWLRDVASFSDVDEGRFAARRVSLRQAAAGAPSSRAAIVRKLQLLDRKEESRPGPLFAAVLAALSLGALLLIRSATRRWRSTASRRGER